MKKLPYPCPVFNVDGTLNQHGTITHACDLLVTKGNKWERQRFFVTNLGQDCLLFGYPWFKAFKPEINWEKGTLLGPKVQMETLLFGTLQHTKTWVKSKIPINEDLILEAQQTRCNPWLGVTPLEIKGGPVEVNCTHTAIEMAHKYATEHGKEEITLPERFKCHMALFSDKEANKFPPTCGEGDHKIVLMDTAPTRFNCKVYPLSRDEQKAEDQFIDENLAKGYITPSDSPYSFSTFMVPKKDSKEKISLIIAPSMWLPGKMSLHSLTSNNALKTYREWNYSVNSTSARAITIFGYTKGTNGKLLSKPAEDYSNQK